VDQPPLHLTEALPFVRELVDLRKGRSDARQVVAGGVELAGEELDSRALARLRHPDVVRRRHQRRGDGAAVLLHRPEIEVPVGLRRRDQRRADPEAEVVTSLVCLQDGSGRYKERARIVVLAELHPPIVGG
jgi:hypothetical protein